MDEPASSLHQPASIAAIRAHLRSCPFENMPALLDSLDRDGRETVRKLAASARVRYNRTAAERLRVEAMYQRMKELAATADGPIVGVDEVGRGSVAGPLTVAAVVLPAEPLIWGLNDSKQLTPKQREEVAARIRAVAPAVGIAHIQPHEIDACGMAASLRLAMRRAIEATGVEPGCVLIDGLPAHVHSREIAVTHGDAQVACIAAASIVAKVTRDAIMVEADELYPGYSFAQSKGYASAAHIAAIQQLGLSPYHRESFCRNFLSAEQQTLPGLTETPSCAEP